MKKDKETEEGDNQKNSEHGRRKARAKEKKSRPTYNTGLLPLGR